MGRGAVPSQKNVRLSEKETLAIVEDMRQKRVESVKNFFTGMAKAVTTDLPGFLMDFTDRLVGDTASFGEKDRSAQLFEKMTGIKTKSGSGGVDEFLGGMIDPISAIGAAKAVIVPAFAAGKSLGQLNKAQEARNLGRDAQDIFTEFGIYPDPAASGLKSVISDTGSKLLTDQLVAKELILKSKATGERQQIRAVSVVPDTVFDITDVIDHPQLQKLIPRTLKDLTIIADPTGFGGGAYNPSLRQISVQKQPSKKDLQSTILHEIQHVIQEDFTLPFGGNSEMFFKNPDRFSASQGKINQLLTDRDYLVGMSDGDITDLVRAQKQLKELQSEAYNLYQRLPGEAEARAVQTLFESNNALLSRAPTTYYDIPLNELIRPWEIGKLDERPEVQKLLDYIAKLPSPSK